MKLLFIAILLSAYGSNLYALERVDKQLENLTGTKAPLVAQDFIDEGYKKLKIGDIDGAANDWEKAIEHHQLFDIYYFIIADKYYDAGEISKSCIYYLKTVEINKYSEQALNRLGICEIYKKNWTQAIAYFNESLEFIPGQALAHYYIATSYGVLKEHDKAKENLDKALSIDPKLELNIDEKNVLYKYL